MPNEKATTLSFTVTSVTPSRAVLDLLVKKQTLYPNFEENPPLLTQTEEDVSPTMTHILGMTHLTVTEVF